MNLMQYIFWFLSFLAILSALYVVFAKSPVHSVLALVITFFAIAGHFLLLSAQFLAAVHIIVYSGAIMVLFLHVIMMLNLNEETEPQKKPVMKLIAVIAAGLLLLTIVAALKGAEVSGIASTDGTIGSVENLGKILFNEFLVPFEISSILFLAAMVGSVYLSKKDLS